jgi:hypothetical protein
LGYYWLAGWHWLDVVHLDTALRAVPTVPVVMPSTIAVKVDVLAIGVENVTADPIIKFLQKCRFSAF